MTFPRELSSKQTYLLGKYNAELTRFIEEPTERNRQKALIAWEEYRESKKNA